MAADQLRGSRLDFNDVASNRGNAIGDDRENRPALGGLVSRRALIAGAGTVAALAAAPIALAAGAPDAAILAAWARYSAARDDLDKLPHSLDSDEEREAEAPFWAICDEAEAIIRDTKAATAAGAAVQIKLALGYNLTHDSHHRALRAGNFDTLADAELYGDEHLLVSALRSLEKMGAGA